MPPKQSMTARNVLALIREQEILTARIHVCNTCGDDVVFNLQATALEESAFKDGIPISTSMAKLLVPATCDSEANQLMHQQASNLHVLPNADSIRVHPEEAIEFDGNLISPETWQPVWWDSRSVAQQAGGWLIQSGAAVAAQFAAQFSIEISELTRLQQRRLIDEISSSACMPQYVQQSYSYRNDQSGSGIGRSPSRLVVQLKMASLIQICDRWMHLREIIARNAAELTNGSVKLCDPVGIQISLGNSNAAGSTSQGDAMPESEQSELLNNVRGLLVQNLSNIQRLVSRADNSRWRETTMKRELQELVHLEYVPNEKSNTLALQICVVDASSNPYFGAAAIAVLLAAGLQSSTQPRLEPSAAIGSLVDFEVGSLMHAEILTAGDVFSEQLLESLSR